MIAYTIRRLLMLIPVLLGVSFLTFAATKAIPGDPVVIMLGTDATPERVALLREKMHLDDPFLVQYGRWLFDVIRGDLGQSYRGQTQVLDEIITRLPSTLELTAVAFLFTIVVGIPVGVITALNRGKTLDNTLMLAALFGLSMPAFWFAIILIIIFGVHLKWIVVPGGESIIDLILPAFTLALGPTAITIRLMRTCVLETINEDYVRTARAKGLRERIINMRHIVRNALIPVITYLGMLFGDFLGGAVLIESVFARAGLGRFAVNAVSARDTPQIQGIVLFIAFIYVIMNLIVDLLYGLIDPRIRYRQNE